MCRLDGNLNEYDVGGDDDDDDDDGDDDDEDCYDVDEDRIHNMMDGWEFGG